MVYCICKAGLLILDCVSGRMSRGGAAGKRNTAVWEGVCVFLFAVLVSIPSIAGFVQGNVLFLYSEKGENVRFSQENAAYPVVVVYNGDYRYRSWVMANELWPYEHVVYVAFQEIDSISGSQLLKSAEKLIVYVVGSEEYLDKMVAQNEKLSSYHLVRMDEFFAIYMLE